MHDWLSFSHTATWTPLREEFALLNVRQQQIQGALALARNDSDDLGEQGIAALKALFESLQLPPAEHRWQLPSNNPFLRPPVKQERAGLIRGQTSAHRGLRTFAQDRSRGRREVAALTFSQALADDSDEGALYLQWRFGSPVAAGVESSLQPLLENARQAGVEVSFEATGSDWLVKMTGLHEPMPAVLEVLAQSLNQPQEAVIAPPPMIPIRALLKALPSCCAAGNVAPHEQPASWATRTLAWPGPGFTHRNSSVDQSGRRPSAWATCPHRTNPAKPRGQRVWHEIKTSSTEAALLLFCPTPQPIPGR